MTTTKVFKRQTSASDSPTKKGAAKKKKRVAAPVGDEEHQQPHKLIASAAAAGAVAATTSTNDMVITPPIKMSSKNQKKMKKSKHKEIIDYSKQNHSNTFGKVQKWLLESPAPSSPSGGATTGNAAAAAAEVEHTSQVVRNMMSKSLSTPERLAARTPKKVQSVGNLNDKVKLQVVYKPPFKFSLKLSKNSAVKTKVIGAGAAAARNKRKPNTGAVQRTEDAVTAMKPRRTALLIRSTSTTHENKLDAVLPNVLAASSSVAVAEDQQHLMVEPNYETLNSKRDGPLYENMVAAGKSDAQHKSPINSATFRIKKSTSGSNLTKQTAAAATPTMMGYQNTGSSATRTRTGSSTNLHQMSASNGTGRNSSTDLSNQFGSSQNLIRSSTTNLTKLNRNSFNIKSGGSGSGHGNDLIRSSTTNLTGSKDRRGSQVNLYKVMRHGSNSNLQFDEIPPSSRSRRNSVNRMMSASPSSPDHNNSGGRATNIPRVPSNSNLKMPTASSRRGSISNIPRANLKTNSFNQHSRYGGGISGGGGGGVSPHGNHHRESKRDTVGGGGGRPHTTDCTDGRQFEWPIAKRHDTKQRSSADTNDPIPSDLEVMISDIENLVNDV